MWSTALKPGAAGDDIGARETKEEVVARKYLEEHNIGHVMDFLFSRVLDERPAKPRVFLYSLLSKLHDVREGKRPPEVLFEDVHFDAIFRMFDVAESGHVTGKQLDRALAIVGMTDEAARTERIASLAVTDTSRVTRDDFRTILRDAAVDLVPYVDEYRLNTIPRPTVTEIRQTEVRITSHQAKRELSRDELEMYRSGALRLEVALAVVDGKNDAPLESLKCERANSPNVTFQVEVSNSNNLLSCVTGLLPDTQYVVRTDQVYHGRVSASSTTGDGAMSASGGGMQPGIVRHSHMTSFRTMSWGLDEFVQESEAWGGVLECDGFVYPLVFTFDYRGRGSWVRVQYDAEDSSKFMCVPSHTSANFVRSDPASGLELCAGHPMGGRTVFRPGLAPERLGVFCSGDRFQVNDEEQLALQPGNEFLSGSRTAGVDTQGEIRELVGQVSLTEATVDDSGKEVLGARIDEETGKLLPHIYLYEIRLPVTTRETTYLGQLIQTYRVVGLFQGHLHPDGKVISGQYVRLVGNEVAMEGTFTVHHGMNEAETREHAIRLGATDATLGNLGIPDEDEDEDAIDDGDDAAEDDGVAEGVNDDSDM